MTVAAQLNEELESKVQEEERAKGGVGAPSSAET